MLLKNIQTAVIYHRNRSLFISFRNPEDGTEDAVAAAAGHPCSNTTRAAASSRVGAAADMVVVSWKQGM